VVDGGGLVGVISQTDLLARGRDGTVADHMTSPVLTVSGGATLREAAQRMLERHIHRVYVVDDGLVGVLSTRDIMAAVAEAKVATPVSSRMSTPVLAVEVGTPLGQAKERLRQAHVTGLVVAEDGWPVGVLAQSDALAAGADADPVDRYMDPALFCVDAALPLHRAAAQAVRMRARRVIACRHREMVGMLSGLDFARAVAEG
jgi:CBS domain-containing protein